MRRKTETKIKGVLQDTLDPRNNTGNINNSIIPVLYQSTVSLTYMHNFRLYYSTTTTYNAMSEA